MPPDSVPILPKSRNNASGIWTAIRQLDWCCTEYGGIDAVRQRLVELAREHRQGSLKLYSLIATVRDPTRMRVPVDPILAMLREVENERRKRKEATACLAGSP